MGLDNLNSLSLLFFALQLIFHLTQMTRRCSEESSITLAYPGQSQAESKKESVGKHITRSKQDTFSILNLGFLIGSLLTHLDLKVSIIFHTVSIRSLSEVFV